MVAQSKNPDSARQPPQHAGPGDFDPGGGHRTFTVQQAAEHSGLSEHNLRFYERAGLIPNVARDPSNGYRRYSVANIMRAQMLHCLRNAGLPLEGMQRYFEQAALGNAAAPQQIALLEAQGAVVRQQIAALEQTLEYLHLKVEFWRALGGGDADTAHELTTTLTARATPDRD